MVIVLIISLKRKFAGSKLKNPFKASNALSQHIDAFEGF